MLSILLSIISLLVVSLIEDIISMKIPTIKFNLTAGIIIGIIIVVYRLIIKYSLLSNILGDKLKVNSIHNYAVSKVSHPFKVVATYKNVTEAIEYKNIIGVQFHPELMNNADELFNWLTN